METLDYYDGYIDGLTAFAWWKDGTQYVGTCGRTLKEAIKEVKEKQGRESIYKSSNSGTVDKES